MAKAKEVIEVDPTVKVDAKSIIKAKIVHWKKERDKYIENANRDIVALDNRVFGLEDLLYSQYPEERPKEPEPQENPPEDVK